MFSNSCDYWSIIINLCSSNIYSKNSLVKLKYHMCNISCKCSQQQKTEKQSRWHHLAIDWYHGIPSLKLTARSWKVEVGILMSFWVPAYFQGLHPGRLTTIHPFYKGKWSSKPSWGHVPCLIFGGVCLFQGVYFFIGIFSSNFFCCLAPQDPHFTIGSQ